MFLQNSDGKNLWLNGNVLSILNFLQCSIIHLMEFYLIIVYFINSHDITTSGAILHLSTLCDNRLCSIYKVLTRDVSLKQHKTTIDK